LKASDKCIAVVKEFEGYASEPYQDLAGYWTWGYGHKQKRGEPIPKHVSEEDATRILCKDLCEAEAGVMASVDVALTQGQFDALVDFTFNLGVARLLSSTLLKLLNAGDYAGACDQLPRWSKVGQNQVGGLLRRRLAEQLLFES
jgi:lysozyme